jgi:hypothetical protein
MDYVKKHLRGAGLQHSCLAHRQECDKARPQLSRERAASFLHLKVPANLEVRTATLDQPLAPCPLPGPSFQAHDLPSILQMLHSASEPTSWHPCQENRAGSSSSKSSLHATIC